MPNITSKARSALPSDKFADPDGRGYPIDTAARARNASARLEQQKSSMPAAKYKAIRARIAKAEKAFGIETKVTADLGVSDVHVPAGVRVKRGKTYHIRADIASGGSLHVRHMRDEDSLLVLDGSSIDAGDASVTMAAGAEADNRSPRVWIQLAKTGRFAGHPSGAFELNTKVFSEIITNFRNDGKPIAIDYEHASEMPATEGSIPTSGAPAQGWIYDLRIDGTNLFGLVEWGAQAREQIKSGAYKFFSPAIRFNSKDRVTGQPIGARLSSGAMTNSPFLTHLEPLAAKETSPMIALAARPMMVGKSHDFMAQCRQCLKLDDAANADEMKSKLANLRGLYSDAEDAHAMCQGVNMSGYTTALSSLMGAPMNMDISDLLDAVEEMIDASMAQHVAEYHGAETAELDDDEGADMVAASDTAQETIDMDPEATKKLTTLETEKTVWMTERTTLLSERDTAVAKNAGLELELKSALADVAAKDEQLKKLTDEANARLMADRETRVEEAFGTYKDAKRLTDGDKDQMRVYLSSNPAGFEKLYPKVEPDKRHLLANIAGAGADKANAATAAQDGPHLTFSMSDLSAQLIAKGWPVDRAQLEAERICKSFSDNSHH